MIGEIRDPETAAIAIRAANSGHLVLATIHAANAAGASRSRAPEVRSTLTSPYRPPLRRRPAPRPHPLPRLLHSLRLGRRTCTHFDEVAHLLSPDEGAPSPPGCSRCHRPATPPVPGLFETPPHLPHPSTTSSPIPPPSAKSASARPRKHARRFRHAAAPQSPRGKHQHRRSLPQHPQRTPRRRRINGLGMQPDQPRPRVAIPGFLPYRLPSRFRASPPCPPSPKASST